MKIWQEKIMKDCYMNMRTGILLFFFIFAILSGVPKSFARPEYLNILNEVYGQGSCSTCHVTDSSGRLQDHNGTFRPDASNGTYRPRTFNRTNDMQSFNRTPGIRNSNRTMPLNSYGSLFEKQPDYATDPGAALITIGDPSKVSTETSGGNHVTLGSYNGVSLIVLFGSAFLLARRQNK